MHTMAMLVTVKLLFVGHIMYVMMFVATLNEPRSKTKGAA